MENSIRTPQDASSTTKQWGANWLSQAWIMALYRRLSLIYMAKFTSNFPDAETIADWSVVWGERLAGLSAAQIKHGLDRVTQECQWPPTLVEFKQFCESAPRPELQKLPTPPRVRTEYASRQSGLIMGMFGESRPPGNWWAHEVMAKVERNEPVTASAFNLAKQAIARGASCVPGSDDEEVHA